MTASHPTLRIQTLGGFRAWIDDEPLSLPPSRQSRALLAYLAFASKPLHRASLCELLWENTPDPRAALRWSLSRLRQVLEAGGVERLVAVDDTLWLSPDACEVDGKRLRDLARMAVEAVTADLEDAVSRFTGPFLADLEIADAYRFESWRVAEEKSLAQARILIFEELLRRHAPSPEATVRIAHIWIQQDPLDERPHIAVIEALTVLGRKREALAQYERCAQMQRRHGGRPNSGLEKARAAIGRLGREDGSGEAVGKPPPRRASGSPHPAALQAEASPARPPLAGRGAEMDRFMRLLAVPDDRLHILSGEPGIGKTRLLEEMNRALGARGWIRLRGRAFEAERGRAFGPWMDAARALAAERPGAAADCPLLRPAALPEFIQSDAYALFEAVREWLASLAGPDADGNTAPMALIFDDIHWLDPISAALLQFLLRGPDRPFRLMLGGIRSVAAAPDAAVEALLRLAHREGWAETWNIGPLDAKDTASLLKALGSRRDPAEVFSRSAGHPLAAVAYALEDGAEARGALVSLETMLDERISLAGDDGRQVLQWSSLIGRGLPPALLESLLDLPLHALLSSLERLESHGLVRVEESETGMEYLFGHDLIRRRAHDSISAPRRTRMHAHVALTLRRHPSLSRGPEETAQHAEMGEQWELAAEACLHAAQHCLRLRAFEAVEKLVERGLDHCARLGSHWALRHDFSFLANQIIFFLDHFPSGLESRLQDLIKEAKVKGQQETAMAALFALAAMRFVQEQPDGMLAAAEQVEFGGEVLNPAGRADSLAGMALCLLVTDLDIPRANRLIEESKRIDAEHAAGMPKILMAAEGWLAWREGRLADARTHLIHARTRMNASDLPQFEQRILGVLAQVELEAGNPRKAMEYAVEMEAFSNLLRYLPDRHFPGAITAMAKALMGDAEAEGIMQESLELLRAENCKAMTAYLLLFHSELDLRAGRRLAEIPARCLEAIERCLPLGRTREPAWARCLLGLAALRQGNRYEARRHWDALDMEMKSTSPLPGHVAKLADELASGLGL